MKEHRPFKGLQRTAFGMREHTTIVARMVFGILIPSAHSNCDDARQTTAHIYSGLGRTGTTAVAGFGLFIFRAGLRKLTTTKATNNLPRRSPGHSREAGHT